MFRAALILLTVPQFVAVAETPPKDPFAGLVPKTVDSKDDTFKIHTDPSGKAYFTAGTEHYYTKSLAAMKEPSLLHRDPKRPEVEYRFLWLRSFDDPVSIRVWRTAEGFMLRAVRITQNKDYSLGATTTDVTRKLTDEESQKLTALLEGSPLTAPMNEIEEAAGDGGLDGARWIFETFANKRYQRLDFWSLKDFGPTQYQDLGFDTSKIRNTAKLLTLALGLIELGGIKIPAERIY